MVMQEVASASKRYQLHGLRLSDRKAGAVPPRICFLRETIGVRTNRQGKSRHLHSVSVVKLDKRGCLAIWAGGANGSGQMSDVKKRHAEALRLVQNRTRYSAKLQACQLPDRRKGLSSQVKAFRVVHSLKTPRKGNSILPRE